MTHRQILETAVTQLNDAGIADAGNDAWLLFSDTFSMNRTDYFMHSSDEGDLDLCSLYYEKVERRRNHEPLQYIIGKACFMGMDFCVNPDVLIPRFDTEVLVEETLKLLNPGDRVLDMCTGSGCIAISLSLLKDVTVTAADISEAALKVASHNREIHNAVKVSPVQSDMFENITGDYDLIVSNPPYIRTGDIKDLEIEVKDKEPLLALDGHEDGLFFYRILIEQGTSFLKKDGILIMEIGYDQSEDIKKLLQKNKYADIRVIKDLAGLDRVVMGRRK